MQTRRTPIKVQTPLGIIINARFLDAEYMNKQYPSTFFIHSELIRNNIPERMWVKCGIQWKNGINENSWIEIVEAAKDDFGRVTYSARFNEFNLGGVESGSIAHGIEPRHIMDYDFERFKKLFIH